MEINRSRYKMIKIWNIKRKIYKKNLFFLKKKHPETYRFSTAIVSIIIKTELEKNKIVLFLP